MFKIIKKDVEEVRADPSYFIRSGSDLPEESSLMCIQTNLNGDCYISGGFDDFLVCKNTGLQINKNSLFTIGLMDVFDIEDDKYGLRIFDIYQDVSDIPRFELIADNFEIYNWDREKSALKDRCDNVVNTPSLDNFIDWYDSKDRLDTEEKFKENSKKILESIEAKYLRIERGIPAESDLLEHGIIKGGNDKFYTKKENELYYPVILTKCGFNFPEGYNFSYSEIKNQYNPSKPNQLILTNGSEVIYGKTLEELN